MKAEHGKHRDATASKAARQLAGTLLHYGAHGVMTRTQLEALRNALTFVRREVTDELQAMPEDPEPSPSPLGVQIARDFFASQMFAQAVANRGAA